MAINDNTNKINELINIINSLPVAGSGSGETGSDGISPTISVVEVSGGHNIIITDINGVKTLFVPNGKDGSPGSDGVGVTSIKQTTTSTASGGTNKITAILSDGTTSVFDIKNGLDGAKGDDGVGITEVTQHATSTEDGGENIVAIALSDGRSHMFTVRNGSKGSPGASGSDATINGVNTLTINTSGGITKSQSGSTMTIGANLTNLLASGPIILKEGTNYHYGDTLPTAGTKGRLFFKRVVE